jgi:uncharacterized membrane-anchored protein
MITGLAEIVAVVAAALLALLVLRPYVPAWAWFTIYVGATLYWLLDIMTEGMGTKRVVAAAIFALAALHAWWTDLRGTRLRGDIPGAGGKQP